MAPRLARLRSTTATAAVAVLAATTVLAGCGSSGKDLSGESATTLLAKSKKQATDSSTLTIKGAAQDSGTSVKVDLTYVGKNFSGTITEGSQSISLRVVGTDAYIKASDAFWEAQGSSGKAIATKLKGKWLGVPTSDSSFSSLTDEFGRSAFVKTVLTPSGSVTKGKKSTVAGVEAIALKSGKGTLYVATDDARPLRINPTTGSSGAVTFGYGKHDAPAAPPTSEVVTESQLAG